MHFKSIGAETRQFSRACIPALPARSAGMPVREYECENANAVIIVQLKRHLYPKIVELYTIISFILLGVRSVNGLTKLKMIYHYQISSLFMS